MLFKVLGLVMMMGLCYGLFAENKGSAFPQQKAATEEAKDERDITFYCSECERWVTTNHECRKASR